MPRTAVRNLLPANDLAVKAAVARDGKTTEYKIADSDGLTLRVEPAHGALVRGEPVGKAAYYVRYTAKGGRRQRLRIGARGVVSLRDARARAKEVALAVGKGEDPVASAIERSESPTLRKLWEDRKEHGEKLAPGTQKYYEQALNQYAFPELGDVPADEITADQLAALLRKIKRVSKHRGHATGSAISSTYSWAFSERLVRSNPILGLSFAYASPARDRVASADEIGRLWCGIESEQRLTLRMRQILKLLLLTAQRNSTVAGARRDELLLDIANPEWRVKRERMKNKSRDHVLPLTPITARLFRDALAGVSEKAVHVFPGEANAVHVSQQSVSRAMKKLCRKLGIEGLHAHDFRRTANSWLADEEVSYDVRRQIMHHAVADITTRVYDRAMLRRPVRDALERWERHVLKCAAGASGEVVELAKRA